jgi:subtilase family serine protease
MCSEKAFPLRLLAVALLCSTALFCTPASKAQSSSIAPRITANIDETRLTTLKGNVPRLARSEYDRGAADSSTQLTHIRLVLSRSSEQQAALDTYLAELQDKSSPNYHKWLTPERFGKLYGPADSDVAALVAWLESHGLKLEAVSTGRTNISFSGTVSQVEEAFHTSIHSFQANDRQFYSNTTNPRIPAALTTVVKGVARLNTIQPRPQYVPGRIGKFDPETGRLRALSISSSQARPQLTTDDNGTQSLYVTPADAATIYNTPNSFNLNNSSSTSYTGSGVTIGIAGDSAIATNYVTAYRSLFLGDTTAPTITNIDNVGTVSGDDSEAYLDLEVSGGLAPGATIHFYTATLLDTAIERALSDNAVDILSLSFGECEQDMDTSDNLLIESWWQQAAGQGIAVTVSSGDTGSAGCDYTSDTNGNNVTDATGGLQVNGLASTPYNIAVGGTDYYALLNSFSTYVTEASSSGSTAGSSSTYYRTAKSYIPESTWNDSTYSDDFLSANVPWTAISGGSSYANIAAGSGGASNCSTNTTTYSGSTTNVGNCTSGYSKPSWQTGAGVPADNERDIPDISLLAADGVDGASWIICYPYTYQGKTYQGCIKQSDGSWYILGMGGTSAATPAFAGILALVEQKTGDRLGQAAQTLYELYNGSHSSAIFHDVTVGNISVPCTSGTANCVENSAGYYFESGYDTTTGYDLATGLGSVDVTALVNYWGSATGTGPTDSVFTVTATTPAAISRPGGSASSTLTLTAAGNYVGTVSLTCALTSSPAGASYLPSCSISPATVALTSTTASGTATATINTTAATSGELVYPKLPGKGRGLFGAASGALLAFVVFLGIPARRRSWRSMLGVLVLMTMLGSLTACGGGGSSSSNNNTGTTGTSGTTAGTYTFTVTGTGSDSATTTETATFSVTVD